MEKMNMYNESLLELTHNEMLIINGGTYNSGYSAGYAAGQYVRKALNDWGILTTIKTLVELF